MFPKKLWIFPIIFGLIGAFIGLLLRYAHTGAVIFSSFSYKNYLHAHSHGMLLGLLFNAILILVWLNFSRKMDRISFRYYISMQVSMAAMIVAFIYQGYAFYSILFSTLHLWISYILLIRLWKRLEGNKELVLLVKSGIFFHFLSSLGPYALGPLMVFDMRDSPWYQQSVFFYLHFQFLGVYFTWMLALLFKKATVILNKFHVLIIVLSLFFLYAHTLDYSFDNWLIQLFGGLGSVMLFAVLFHLRSFFYNSNRNLRNIYLLVLTVTIVNFAGSFPWLADLVVSNRFVLIAYLHFLFLALYIPFIWVFLGKKISVHVWILYAVSVIFSEIFLLFPGTISIWIPVSVMDLLFYAYSGVFLSIAFVHLPIIFTNKNIKILDQ